EKRNDCFVPATIGAIPIVANWISWDGKSSGSLAPMNIIGTDLGQAAPINPISYYWYGTYGSGDKTIIPFLEHDNKHYGFIFCPENVGYGKMVTISDQDWVRTNDNPILMNQILKYLVDNPAYSEMPSVAIESDQDLPCDGSIATFTANMNINIPSASLQWSVNGTDIIGANQASYSTDALDEGDVIGCRLEMMGDCGMFTILSLPVIYSEIFPLTPPSVSISADMESACEGETITFSPTISGAEQASELHYQWMLNGELVAQSESWAVDHLKDGDEVSLLFIYNDECSADNVVFSNTIVVQIKTQLDPTILIEPNYLAICQGQKVRFTATGHHWGDQPNIKWTIDGQEVANGQSTFETDLLEKGQVVKCHITSSAICATNSEISSNPISIEVNELQMPSVLIVPQQQSICLGEMAYFRAEPKIGGDTPSFQWVVNGQAAGQNSANFETSNLTNGAVVSCIMTSTAQCLVTSEVLSQNIEMEVSTPIDPQVSIQVDKAFSCVGSDLTFTFEGNDLGDYPTFQWLVNGKPSGITAASFTSNAFNQDDIVSLRVLLNSDCQTSDEVTSAGITVERSLPGIQVIELETEKCGHHNGLIEVETLGGISPYTYAWNTGDVESFLTDLSAGAYSVTVSDAIGCTATLSTTLDQESDELISELYVIQPDCDANPGKATVFVNDNTQDYQFNWQTMSGQSLSDAQTAEELVAGSYIVEVSNEYNCVDRDTIHISASPAIEVQMPESTTINLGDEIELPVYAYTQAGELSYTWLNGEDLSCTDCSQPKAQTLHSTTYQLEISNEAGCTVLEKVSVEVLPKRDLFIPNAFTPNGDGHNDTFTVFAGDQVSAIKNLQIFDRWGSVLFSQQNVIANSEQDGWDGTFGGKQMGMGVYIYQMEVEYIDGSQEIVSGDMSILP
ncbi:MAG: T9SS type B sorting domain-containing protein, partial [Bacteroidota bacterium]